MKFVYIDSGVVRESVQSDPATLFVPMYAARFIDAPDYVEVGWLYDGHTFTATPVVVDRPALIADIDRRADGLRLAIVGDPVRVEEYRLARDEAEAYIAAGYTGAVPPTVQAWATAKTWTAQQAADDIAVTAQAWESALYAIRSIRLIGKEAVRNAANDSDAQSAYDTALSQLAAISGA